MLMKTLGIGVISKFCGKGLDVESEAYGGMAWWLDPYLPSSLGHPLPTEEGKAPIAGLPALLPPRWDGLTLNLQDRSLDRVADAELLEGLPERGQRVLGVGSDVSECLGHAA